MTKVKKFVEGSDKEIVELDNVGANDWVLSWTPDGDQSDSGFTLFTPRAFNPESEGGPMGGLALAAVYFLLQNGDTSFAKELIKRANDLSKEMEQESSMKTPPDRTLN